MEEPKYIYLFNKSDRDDSDYYGDYNYKYNPLSKYKVNCKLFESAYFYNSPHGYGVAAIAVKTTLEALKLLGWESDYEKYKSDEIHFNNGDIYI